MTVRGTQLGWFALTKTRIREIADFLNLDVQYSELILGDVITRLRRDIERLEHFHGDISSLKTGCLIAFWIVKLKPFSLPTPPEGKPNWERFINETLAFFVMCSFLTRPNQCIKSKFVHDYLYTTRYRDFSSSAVITLCESIDIHCQ